ncbi:MAG: hypothetical protein AAF581_00430 [Planctomycetota bacterium]
MSEEEGVLAVILVVAGIIILVALAFQLWACYFLMKCFEKIPESYRRQQPAMVWLLLIPCFGIIWNFFVLPNLALSYQDFFRANGRYENDDCGHGIALACCICSAASLIVALAGLVSLVLLIIFLVKAKNLRDEIDDASANVFA